MTTSLVTGGSGYFGSLLVERLLQSGHDVRVFDLNDTPDRQSGVEFVAGDIRDPDAVATAVTGCDAVFNNVAQVPLAKDHRLFKLKGESLDKRNAHSRQLSESSSPYKPQWVQHMIARRRKTIVVCRACHQAITHGRYDGPRVN